MTGRNMLVIGFVVVVNNLNVWLFDGPVVMRTFICVICVVVAFMVGFNEAHLQLRRALSGRRR
jgi:hypothetical protein